MTGIKDRDRQKESKAAKYFVITNTMRPYKKQAERCDVTIKTFFFYLCGSILYNKRVNGAHRSGD